MASSKPFRTFAGLLVVLWTCRLYANACYSSIISFGDSISDTGNRKYLASITNFEFNCPSPYGQDFINHSTGRCSNGRLIVDFLAESIELPLTPAYFNKEVGGVEALRRQGVNYAVSGATALDSSIIEARWGGGVVINASLGVQLAWLKQSLSSVCDNTTDCRNLLGNSLILMGVIGSNDYNTALSVGTPIDEIQPLVPLVVGAIISGVNELIEMGARTLVVPGNLPFGCLPASMTVYGSPSEEYDPITSCLTKLNNLAEYHNKMLQTKLNRIRELNPNVVVIYADYYNAFMQMYLSPNEYGFTNDGTLNACCGCGGLFNCDITKGSCGQACTTILCDKPDTYISWDGVHLTEAANKVVFKSVFQGPYTTPEFKSLCPSSTSQAGVGLSSYV